MTRHDRRTARAGRGERHTAAATVAMPLSCTVLILSSRTLTFVVTATLAEGSALVDMKM